MTDDYTDLAREVPIAVETVGTQPRIEQLYEPLELRIEVPLAHAAVSADGTVNGTVAQDGTANGTIVQVGTANGTVTSDDKATGNSEDRVLRLLAADPSLSYEQIAEKLAISRRSVARVIKTLREQGKIKRDGSDKTGTWIVSKEGD